MDQSVSGSVKQVILDAKVGPPLYEKGLAKDILSVVSILKDCQDLYWFVLYCASFGLKCHFYHLDQIWFPSIAVYFLCTSMYFCSEYMKVHLLDYCACKIENASYIWNCLI